jgi:hypothetical protein
MSRPFVHNAKVMWIANGKSFPVQQCHDVHYAIARKYVHDHKHDPEYRGGKLIAVSMLQKASS